MGSWSLFELSVVNHTYKLYITDLCSQAAYVHASYCGEPAISLHSHHVSLVQWTNRLLPIMRDSGSIPRGYLCETGILLLAMSRYIGDPDVIDHCGLIWGGLRPEPLLGPRADNVIIPLDLTQLFCPGFTLAAGPPSGFTTDTVSCWGGALWRACNLTAFTPCLTGPLDYPFASHHEGPGFNPWGGGTYVQPGFSF
jgi:hypothetical protein